MHDLTQGVDSTHASTANDKDDENQHSESENSPDLESERQAERQQQEGGKQPQSDPGHQSLDAEPPQQAALDDVEPERPHADDAKRERLGDDDTGPDTPPDEIVRRLKIDRLDEVQRDICRVRVTMHHRVLLSGGPTQTSPCQKSQEWAAPP